MAPSKMGRRCASAFGRFIAAKTDDANIEANLTLDRGVWNDTTYRGWTLRLEGGYLKREYKQGTSAAEKMTLMALKANTWYEGVLTIDGSDPNTASSSYPPRFRIVVWERDNPNVWAQNRLSFATYWSYTERNPGKRLLAGLTRSGN